ncbi:VRR-NUC domain-containing protein [Saccharospirillum impatiens]|uniref:VRR-NUC domain-containing protein n=1 Tax=Saccharospirillum impatiens TaxID=169438 RepID=UPI00041A2DCB|nr:VRR-NUC domain-containing protein [Saccharospirillum impatiens]
MSMTEPIDLPEGYYLDNFLQLVSTVGERYSDLLDPTDQAFLAQFRQLSTTAARLLVRLYIRKGPVFRVNRLAYPDVGAIGPAVAELIEAGLLDPAPDLTAAQIVRLLTLADLKHWPWNPDPRLSKAALLDHAARIPDLGSPDYWHITEPLVARCHDAALRRLQLMYFGNGRQSLTDFVLSDLGVFRYERYPLGRAQRWFQEPADINQTLQLMDLREQYYQAIETKSDESLPALADACLAITWRPRVQERAFRLMNQLGFRLEQSGDWTRAMTLFGTNDAPPARERRCRLLYKLEHYTACWEALQPVLDAPQDASEARFGLRFQPRLARKLKRPVLRVLAPTVAEYRVEWHPAAAMSVEQLACSHLNDAVWLENQLPLAIFTLVHWSWWFADVPGAFHHPFQSGPADIYQPDFLQRRGTDRLHLYQTLTRQTARQHLEQNIREKTGLQNPFFGWSGGLDTSVLLRCFDAVPWPHWVAIFQHLWLDLKRHRSGFPDLFQFLPGGYRFIEIKGPGDRLQDNQRDWLGVFNEHGIPAEVWYVDYATPGDNTPADDAVS